MGNSFSPCVNWLNSVRSNNLTNFILFDIQLRRYLKDHLHHVARGLSEAEKEPVMALFQPRRLIGGKLFSEMHSGGNRLLMAFEPENKIPDEFVTIKDHRMVGFYMVRYRQHDG